MQQQCSTVRCIDSTAFALSDLQACIGESIAKHQPLVIQQAFPYGINVRSFAFRLCRHFNFERAEPVILIQPPQDLEKVIKLHGGIVCPISQVINGEVTGILDQAKYAQ